MILVTVLLGVGTAGILKAGGKSAAGGEIFRAPAASTGVNAYTASVASTDPGTEASSLVVAPHLPPPAAALTPPRGAPVDSVASFTGSTPGLYGGTRQLSTCNAAQMVTYLQANPQKEAAWASVEQIPVADVPSYVSQLTSVVLRMDTRVTNHGFINGRATTIPEVLQAGTAVLVDRYGVPRARCFCGNPLTPPVAVSGTPTYTGPTWPAFSPAMVAAVVKAPKPVTALTLVDVNTGQPFVRPAGTSGATDAPAPANALAGSPFSGASAVAQGGSSPTGTPDLTGSWEATDGSGPPWILQASPDRQSLHASWRGGPGHSTLVGTFDGTLQSGGRSYSGIMSVTEAGTQVGGTMTITADSDNQITISYHAANGTGGVIVLVRQSSSAGGGGSSGSSTTTTGASSSGSSTTTSTAAPSSTTTAAPSSSTTVAQASTVCVPGTIQVNGTEVAGSGSNSSKSFAYTVTTSNVTITVSGLGPHPPCQLHYLVQMSGSDPQGGRESGSNCKPGPSFTSGPWGTNPGDNLAITVSEAATC